MFVMSGVDTEKKYFEESTKEGLLRKASKKFPTSKPARKDVLNSRESLNDPIYPEPMRIIEIR